MSYLNLDLDYFNHRKTSRLVGLLGKDSEVLPIKLWCYVGKYHSVDGRLSGYSPQEVESLVGWWGKPGQMVEAMIKVRFLTQTVDGFEVTDWLEHEGHLKMFKERARFAANVRWGISNATSIPQAYHKQCPIPSVPTGPTKEINVKERKRIFFQKPTAEEVSLYAKSIDFPLLDAQKFVDFYESKGWVIGKSPMRDWKATVRTWRKGDNNGTRKNGLQQDFKGDNTAGTVNTTKYDKTGIPD